MRDSYCIENDFAAQKELAEKDRANIDEQWEDRLKFNALSLRAERAEAKLSLWQKDMNEVLRQRDDLRSRVTRLEEVLPDPRRLEILAAWFDLNFKDDRNPEVQNDLREWAKKIRRALEEK